METGQENNRRTARKARSPTSRALHRFSDTTVEALAPLLLANPRGLLMARDELAGWIGSFDRYAGGRGGADSAHWLSMHNGESIIVDRKTGIPRTIYVPQASVSVCGGIQPAILHRALGMEHRESGWRRRLLLTCPPRIAKRWTEADIDPTAEAEIAGLIDRLYELQPTVGDDGELRPVVVGLTPRRQSGVEGVLQRPRARASGPGRRLVGRVGQAGRIRGPAGAGDSLRPLGAPTIPTLTNATMRGRGEHGSRDRLATWFKHEARRVYAMLGETDDDRDQRRLVEWIERKGGSTTPAKCKWAAVGCGKPARRKRPWNYCQRPAGEIGNRRHPAIADNRRGIFACQRRQSSTVIVHCPVKTAIPLTLTRLTRPNRKPMANGGSMSAAELLLDLGRLGIRLETQGDQLRYHPRSALTPDAHGPRLNAHKADVLAMLRPAPECGPGPAHCDERDAPLKSMTAGMSMRFDNLAGRTDSRRGISSAGLRPMRAVSRLHGMVRKRYFTK